MRIEHSFDYDVTSDELSDEFCKYDSEYQADTINEIGLQFKIWSQVVLMLLLIFIIYATTQIGG